MNTTLVLVALIVFAFVVSRFLHRYADRLAMVSGSEYVLVGVLIGPLAPFGLVDEQTWVSLDLLVTLLLGLLGFMVGLHARAALRRFEHFLAGSLASLAVALAVTIACLGLIQWLEPSYLSAPDPRVEIPVWTDGERLYQIWAADDALWLSLTLGAAAAVASSSAITEGVQRWRAEGSVVELLGDLASAGQVLAVVACGFALAGDRAEAADLHGLSLAEWALLIGAAGAVSGLLFTIFIGGAEDDVRLYVATIGAVIFAAGIGAALGVSSLFVNLVAGLTVAGTSSHADRLQVNLEPLKRPVSVLLLVFAGIAWQPVLGWAWLVPAAYLLVRLGVRLVATHWAVMTFVHGAEFRRLGAGLLGQGALAAAIGLSYAQRHPDTSPLVMSAVLVPMLVFDVFSFRSLRRVLANAGAIRPRPPAPVATVAAEPAEPAEPVERDAGEEVER